MTSQLVIGQGEVGRALAAVLDCDIVDVHTEHDFDDEYEMLHIAFPYGDDFVSEVSRYEAIHGAEVVVVHSTVPVGTCDPRGWVHSPVRGQHPALVKGIQTFVKPVGTYDRESFYAVQEVFGAAGVECRRASSARSTELGKLLELVQYGVEIRMQKEAFYLAREYGVDPKEAYFYHGEEYNEGYASLGYDHYVKPILTEIPGPLGGHCVAPAPLHLGSDFFEELIYPITEDGWDGRLT